MEIKPHGGLCCGMRHIHALNSPKYMTQQTLQWELGNTGTPKYVKRDNPITYEGLFGEMMAHIRGRQTYKGYEGRGVGLLVEVVLTDGQLYREGRAWVPILKKHGFRLVSRFRNSNTAAFCNVFHSHPHFDDVVPNWWKDGEKKEEEK
jgi:hypothetical protein